MIKIDHTLLSEDALENLIIEVITRQTTDYGEYDIDILVKKNQLKQKLGSGEAVIVFNEHEESCDIIRVEAYQSFQLSMNTSKIAKDNM